MTKAVTAIALLLAACAAPRTPQPRDPLVGSWRGELRVGVAKLEVVLHVAKNEDGYTATFDSVTQGARGIPVASVTLEGDLLTARLPRIGAEYVATFVAATGAGSKQLDGTWSQGGRKLDLDLAPGKERPQRRPQHPTGDVPYAQEEVAFGHDPSEDLAASFRVGGGAPVTLSGTLTIPAGDGPHPAAVMITGSGPQDRDESLLGHKPFLVIADHLSRRGVAVLRFDDRGTAASTGDFAMATSADFAEDARAALRYLRTRDDIDHARVGLIGHSEGGAVAPMVAAGPDADMVHFAVLIAPPSVKLREVLARQSELIGLAEGGDAEAVARNVEISQRAIDAVVASPDDAAARKAALKKIAAEYRAKFPEEAPETIDSALARIDTPWMRWLLDYDPAPSLQKTECEVLAMFGGKDLQVDPAQNRPPLEAALADRTKPAKVVTVRGVNHLFQHTETGRPSEYGELEETFAPEALQLMQEWIAAVTAR